MSKIKKTHKIGNVWRTYRGLTACGQSYLLTKELKTTTRWDQTTCKNCLKTRKYAKNKKYVKIKNS